MKNVADSAEIDMSTATRKSWYGILRLDGGWYKL